MKSKTAHQTSSYSAILNDNGTANVWSVTDQAWETVKTAADYGRVFRTVEQERDVVTRHLLGDAMPALDAKLAGLNNDETKPAVGLFEMMKRQRFAL